VRAGKDNRGQGGPHHEPQVVLHRVIRTVQKRMKLSYPGAVSAGLWGTCSSRAWDRLGSCDGDTGEGLM
jgi:hypothetical protein